MKEDAILIEGSSDRCLSLGMSHRGKVFNNGRAPFGGHKYYFGVCGRKGLFMSR